MAEVSADPVELPGNWLARLAGRARSPWASGAIGLLVATAGLNISNFVFHAVVGHALGPARYGELTPILGFVSILALPLGALEAAVAQSTAEAVAAGRPVRCGRMMRWALLIGLGGAVLWLALAPLFGGFLHLSSFTASALLAPWFVFASSCAALQGVLVGQGRYRGVAVSQLVGNGLVRLVAGVALVESGFGVSGAVAATTLAGIAAVGILMWPLRHELGADATGLRLGAGDTTRSVGALSGITLLTVLDVWLARHFLPSGQAGYFSGAATLGRITLFAPGAITLVVFPRLVATAGRGPRARAELGRALAYVTGMSATAAVALGVLAGPLVRVFFGASYLPAAHILGVVGAADAAVAVAGQLTYFFLARRSRWAWVAWPGCILAVLLAAVFHGSTRTVAYDMLAADLVTVLVAAGAAAHQLTSEIDLRRLCAGRLGAHPARIALGSGVVGVCSVVLLGGLGSGTSGAVLAGIAVVAFGVSVVAGAVQCWSGQPHGAPDRPPASRTDTGLSWMGAGVVAFVAIAACSSWFRPGTVVAGGDITPPQGLAWISHMFEPWTWSGSGLGGPNGQAVQLPWAAALSIVHVLGGSEGLTQQIWVTLLFSCAGLACYGLLRLLAFGPAGSAVGALAYLFNPYTVSTVGNNEVFLAGMLLTALVACIVVAVGRGRVSWWVGVLVLGCTAPLWGYVYSNPPLLLLVVAAACVAVVASGLLAGRSAIRRCALLVVVGVPLLLLLSAYWIVPSLIATQSAATGSLSATSSWTWTEGRATLENGLWLNSIWGWVHPEYYPYAAEFSDFPLVLVKFLLPAAALAGVPVALASRRVSGRVKVMALLAAGAALSLIVFATGTRLPGSIVFDPVYRLPLGWLLREPNRFLMGVALAYAVLLATTVDVGWAALRPFLMERLPGWRPLAHAGLRTGAMTAFVGVALIIPNYPLAFGQIVPAKRSDLPGTHVKLPAYWTSMASYVDHAAPSGRVLIMPPDDFYQMPYSWGFYGNDGFITQLIGRDVLDPTGSGYTAGSGEVLTAVDHVASDLLATRWLSANRILGALGTRLVLVRGDIDSSFPGRTITAPAAIADGLRRDPDARLIHSDGPLQLWALPPAPPPSLVATTEATAPNLEVLSSLPSGTRLVTSNPRPGTATITDLSSAGSWVVVDGHLQTTVPTSPEDRYALAAVPSWTGPPAPDQASPAAFSLKPLDATHTAVVAATTDVLPNGQFAAGAWQPQVGDCEAIHGAAASHLSATVLPGTAPDGSASLQLSAGLDSACESEAVPVSTGPVVLSYAVDDVTGAAGRACYWEVNLGKCAPDRSTTESSGPGWHSVQSIVTPDPGTTSARLFLYSDAGNGPPTAVRYADVALLEIPSVVPELVSEPIQVPPGASNLLVTDEGYSADWTGPKGSEHVLVDGMVNGWIGGSGTARDVTYRWTSIIDAAGSISIVVASGCVVAALALFGRRRVARRR